MIELLTLCGFEEQEIELELPRIEKAFNKLGINTEDIERGKQRLRKYYDIELKGIRKVFRLCIRELVNVMLVREESEKKVIYGFMAPGIDLICSALMSKPNNVMAISQCWALQIVHGCIFGKIVTVLEDAEKKWLKAGLVAHCANVKSLVGSLTLNLLPKPDLLITTGFLCETAPKTLDILHELYNIPVCYIDTCKDRDKLEYPEPVDRIADLAEKSMRKLTEKIQEITGVEITDSMISDVMDAKGKLGDALNRIRELVQNSDPLPLSPSHENLWMYLNSLMFNIDEINEVTETINMLYDELKLRVDSGLGVVEKGAPRVLAILPAGQTDPRLEYLACEVGIAIVAIDTGSTAPSKKTSKNPYMKFGLELEQAPLDLTLTGRIPYIIDICKKLNVDGVLDRYHVGCRSVTADALVIQEAVKKELGIPVLVMEWENFDPRAYNHEQFKRRLEIFKTIMTQSSA
jgi:benzoyl-CoA reductase/2-hydroxyglutaryl-CoA dehydratase subunit BcrC/BadD/HgdB